MRRSIVWPPKVVAGRLAMHPDPASVTADPNVAVGQIVALGCLDATSTNPWNTAEQLGIEEQAFRPDDGALRAGVKRRFRQWERERRARLIAVEAKKSGSETRIRIEYENLETSERLDMELSGNG